MTQKCVLLVEDDTSIATLYGIKLELAGFTVVKAGHGLEALQALSVEVPDIILLDLRMPHMNGEEFLHRIRRQPAYAEIPVLVMTNISREEAPRTIWHNGISGYFVKAQGTPASLVEAVQRILD